MICFFESVFPFFIRLLTAWRQRQSLPEDPRLLCGSLRLGLGLVCHTDLSCFRHLDQAGGSSWRTPHDAAGRGCGDVSRKFLALWNSKQNRKGLLCVNKREKSNLVGVRFVVARRFYLCRSLGTSKQLGFGVSQLVRGERKRERERERERTGKLESESRGYRKRAIATPT